MSMSTSTGTASRPRTSVIDTFVPPGLNAEGEINVAGASHALIEVDGVSEINLTIAVSGAVDADTVHPYQFDPASGAIGYSGGPAAIVVPLFGVVGTLAIEIENASEVVGPMSAWVTLSYGGW